MRFHSDTAELRLMTPDEWLVLVMLLQRQPAICIAREDRRFLRDMVNILTLDDATEPLPWQRKWILTLRRECRL
jgi:hypothetical protein